MCLDKHYIIKKYWGAEIFYALSYPSAPDGGEKFHVPATLPSVKKASVRIGYGAGTGSLEPLTELSKAFINMEKLMSHTRVRKEQRGL
jgi:hypothetical protein